MPPYQQRPAVRLFEGAWRPLWFASPQRDQGRLVLVLVVTPRVLVVVVLPVPDGITKAGLKSSRGREEEEDVT